MMPQKPRGKVVAAPDMLFDNVGNERALLAAILTIPNSVIEIMDVVREVDVLSPHNKALFVCVSSLYREQGITSFDITTLVNEAQRLGVFETCGGFDYIASLFNTKVLRDNIRVFVQNIIEHSSKKALFDQLTEMREEVVGNISGPSVKNSSCLIVAAEERLSTVLAHSNRIDDAEDLGDGIDGFITELQRSPSSIVGLPTGCSVLDSRINGLVPGSLTILAARAKVGKSALLLNWARHLAYDMGMPILYIDTEMSTREVKTRVLSNLSGVRERDIANGLFVTEANKTERVISAAEVMKGGSFYHRYLPGAPMDKIIGMARRYHVNKKIGAIFFDYIKLPDGSDLKNNKEHQVLGYIAAALKDLAGTLGVPVVTAAQVGRVGANKGYLRSDMIADSDRLLRYCNNLLGLCPKAQEELTAAKEGKSPDEFMRYLDLNGSHRLQILETRAGGTLYEGINLTFQKSIMRIRESDFQPYASQNTKDTDTDF